MMTHFQNHLEQDCAAVRDTSQNDYREYKWAYSEDWVFIFLLGTCLYMQAHNIGLALSSQDQSVVMISAAAVTAMALCILFLLGNMILRHHVYYVVQVSRSGIRYGHVTDRVPHLPKDKMRTIARADIADAWVSREKKAIFIRLKSGEEHRISLYRIKPWLFDGLRHELHALVPAQAQAQAEDKKMEGAQ